MGNPESPRVLTFTFPKMPSWMDNPPIFPSINYIYKNAPILGKASYYGKFDGSKIPRDTFSCGPLAIADGRRFNPFKPYIAARDEIKKGSFVEVTLVNKNGKPIENESGQPIIVLAEAADWGPAEVTGRRFDLSYGLAEFLRGQAGGKKDKYGNIIASGEKYIKVRTINLDEYSKRIVRAYIFPHKLTNINKIDPKKYEKYTSCLTIEKRDDGQYVVPSVGDKIAVGLKDILKFTIPKNTCFIKNAYQFCYSSKQANNREASLQNRRYLMRKFDIQRYLFHPFKNGGCYGAHIGPLTPPQAHYLHSLIATLPGEQYNFSEVVFDENFAPTSKK